MKKLLIKDLKTLIDTVPADVFGGYKDLVFHLFKEYCKAKGMLFENPIEAWNGFLMYAKKKLEEPTYWTSGRRTAIALLKPFEEYLRDYASSAVFDNYKTYTRAICNCGTQFIAKDNDVRINYGQNGGHYHADGYICPNCENYIYQHTYEECRNKECQNIIKITQMRV